MVPFISTHCDEKNVISGRRADTARYASSPDRTGEPLTDLPPMQCVLIPRSMALSAVSILFVNRVISRCSAICGKRKLDVLDPSNMTICPSAKSEDAFFAIFV